MGGDDHGRPAQIHSLQQLQDFYGQGCVQVARRLISQEDQGIVDNGPRQADSLLFARGES